MINEEFKKAILDYYAKSSNATTENLVNLINNTLLANGLKIKDIDQIMLKNIKLGYKHKLRNFFKNNKYIDYKCVLCGCEDQKLQMHHIKNVSGYPELKFDVNNIILVCGTCHKIVHGQNQDFNHEIQ